ncbi:glycerophosphoryl diester phosphodiesterase [Friedmanniella endophytica]|uniref:Glycerophosphoryl diester phosphodiesterase n=1 Tax=Microlunatus kandeliicorticis TaxID=1759536 RepID=A0A7W3P7D0_9ACTN|nr:glycerophosphodiester phosphodiesterase [Microlunatus kandeliicorticis]MBA8796006.1 glycerophosphoryl diester phosphodiesterase [Microlunatus kandeliicorticis]
MTGRRPAAKGPIGTRRIGTSAVVAVAHRGDPWRHRENTLPAVAEAVRARADVVEIDVKTSAEGDVVVLHDDTLDRLWGDPRAVTACSYVELAALGGGGPGIPTLDTVLALLGGTGTALMIDMDAPRWAEPAWTTVQRAIETRVITRDEVLWCGRTDALATVRGLDPDARIVLSWDESDGADHDGPGTLPPDAHLETLRPEAVNPHWPMITGEALAWARDHRIPLCCWTVDDEDTMRALIAAGVRAMISNDIRTLRRVIDETTEETA